MRALHLELAHIAKSFDGLRALDGISLTVGPGEILGLIGPNGAGKTTLFNVITGFIRPDGGTALFNGASLIGLGPHRVAMLGIARTFQNLRVVRRLSLLDNVMLAFRAQPGERLTGVFLCPRASKRTEASNRELARSFLECADLTGNQHDLAGNLSYGQQKLLSLACCLATDAALLLLDEPIAGVAPGMREKVLSVITSLPAQGKSVIMIEHNLDAMMHVCGRIAFMNAGEILSIGAPDAVRSNPKVIEAYLH